MLFLYTHNITHNARSTNTMSGTTNINGKNISWTIVPSSGNTNLGRDGKIYRSNI
jgi:hypothetical protein